MWNDLSYAWQIYIDMKDIRQTHISLLHSLLQIYAGESKTTCTVKIPVSRDILMWQWDNSSWEFNLQTSGTTLPMKACHISKNLYLQQQQHCANLKRKVHLPTLLLKILHFHVAHFHDMSMCPPYLLHTLLIALVHSTIHLIFWQEQPFFIRGFRFSEEG